MKLLTAVIQHLHREGVDKNSLVNRMLTTYTGQRIHAFIRWFLMPVGGLAK